MPKKTKDALEILSRDIGGDEELRDLVKEEHLNVRIAQLVYGAREAAKLTQTQLAKLVGTKQSAISRLEDADCEGGHSTTMLERIASALGRKLVLYFEEPDFEDERIDHAT